MLISVGTLGFFYTRYHFYGKWSSNWIDTLNKEELARWSELNKKYVKQRLGIPERIPAQAREIDEEETL